MEQLQDTPIGGDSDANVPRTAVQDSLGTSHAPSQQQKASAGPQMASARPPKITHKEPLGLFCGRIPPHIIRGGRSKREPWDRGALTLLYTLYVHTLRKRAHNLPLP